jgi:hypothetical protein
VRSVRVAGRDALGVEPSNDLARRVVGCPRRNGTGPDQDVSKSRIESRAHHDEDVVVFDQVAEDNRSQQPNGRMTYR